jgi:beta-lactam-binding protein with PASTA domain
MNNKDKKERKASFFRFFISKRFFLNLGIMIVVTIVLVWVTFFLLNSFTNHGEAISVPNFTGRTIAEVQEIIKEKSLNFEVIDSVYSDKVERGTVINQVPRPDQKVKHNRTVYITLNAFLPKQISMPDFVDLELRSANSLAETYGLKICDKKFVPNQFPTILKQLYKGKEIKKGELIPKGSCINLVIGRGSSGEKVLVPRILGLTLIKADSVLTNYALNIGAPIYDPSVITKEDTLNAKIYKQNPMPYEDNEIRIGDFMDVWLTIDNDLVPSSDTTRIESLPEEAE